MRACLSSNSNSARSVWSAPDFLQALHLWECE